MEWWLEIENGIFVGAAATCMSVNNCIGYSIYVGLEHARHSWNMHDTRHIVREQMDKRTGKEEAKYPSRQPKI